MDWGLPTAGAESCSATVPYPPCINKSLSDLSDESDSRW